MKASRNLFIGFGVAIGVLVLIAVALALFTRGTAVTLKPENTPEGTVQRFLLALQEKDYPGAYNYLKVEEAGRGLTYGEWLQSVPQPPFSSQTAWKATLSKTSVTGTSATVEVAVDTFRPGGPFEDPVRTQTVIFALTKIGDTWFISNRPPIYWLY